MPGPVFLRGDRVTLRTTEEADVDFLQRNRNDPEVRHLMRNVDPVTGAEAEEGFEEWISNDDSVNLLICRDEEPMGMISMMHYDETVRKGWLGLWMDKDYHGHGYGPEGTALFIEHGFHERGAHKFCAAVFEPNRPSQRVMEKLGFTREAVERDAEFIDGEYVDTYVYGLLRDEWDYAFETDPYADVRQFEGE